MRLWPSPHLPHTHPHPHGPFPHLETGERQKSVHGYRKMRPSVFFMVLVLPLWESGARGPLGGQFLRGGGLGLCCSPISRGTLGP